MRYVIQDGGTCTFPDPMSCPTYLQMYWRLQWEASERAYKLWCEHRESQD